MCASGEKALVTKFGRWIWGDQVSLSKTMNVIVAVGTNQVSKPAKTSNKYHSFGNTVLLKKHHSFYEHQLIYIMKNILPQHSRKPHSLCKFSRKPFSGWYEIKHLHCIISRFPKTLHSESTWKANAYTFL